MKKFEIHFNNFLGGFVPAWWKNTYPAYGNANQAGDMQNVDLTDPNVLTQGPGLTSLTNGTEAGVVSTLIRSILDRAQASNLTFAVGGNKFYELSSTTVSSNASNPALPHTIDKAAVTGEDAENVIDFRSAIYYSYNYTGGGDIGKYDLTRDSDNDFDDDWGSTVPATGATALQAAVPHQFAKTAEFLYVTNKNYITSYDAVNDIMTEQALDLPTNAEIQSHVIADDRLYIAANIPDLTGSNKCSGSIYKWDRDSSSWDPDSVFGLGRVGALIVKDGVVFVFHQDITSSGGYHLSYISGNQVKDIVYYKGSLPQYYQVTIVEGFIVWESNALLYAWGSNDPSLPVRLFQYMDPGYSTVGGIAAPFGTIMCASNQSTSYKLAKASGYDTACNWKSINIDLSAHKGLGNSFIDRLIINFDTLAADARVDTTLRCDLGGSTWGGTTTGRISHTGDGAVTQKIFYPKKQAKSFRLEFDFSNGNTTNPVKIRSVHIFGHTLGE